MPMTSYQVVAHYFLLKKANFSTIANIISGGDLRPTFCYRKKADLEV